MRLRIPDLPTERGHTTWTVAEASNDRISYNTLYRIAKKRGRVKLFDASLMAALCDVLDVKPGELLTRDDEPGYRPPEKPPVRKRKGKG